MISYFGVIFSQFLIPEPISGPIWFPISGRRPETYFLAGRLDRNSNSRFFAPFSGPSWHLPRQPPLGQPLSSQFALHARFTRLRILLREYCFGEEKLTELFQKELAGRVGRKSKQCPARWCPENVAGECLRTRFPRHGLPLREQLNAVQVMALNPHPFPCFVGYPWSFLRRRTNMQQLTCNIDLSRSFYYLFFSFVLLLELKPFVSKGKVLGEKFWKSVKKCEKVWKFWNDFAL